MKPLLMTLIVAPLSGCALMHIPYQEPNTGPVATVTFKNESLSNLSISYFATSRFCTGRRTVGSIGPQRTLISKVRGDAELTFQYILSAGNKYCLMNLRFFPRSDGKYEFRTIDDALSCKWLMLDVSDPSSVRRVNLTELQWKRGWDENSSFCGEVPE